MPLSLESVFVSVPVAALIAMVTFRDSLIGLVVGWISGILCLVYADLLISCPSDALVLGLLGVVKGVLYLF